MIRPPPRHTRTDTLCPDTTLFRARRASPGDYGLVLANGGFLSKEAVGAYSTEPVSGWTPRVDAGAQAEIDESAAPVRRAGPTEEEIDSYTVSWKRRQPSRRQDARRGWQECVGACRDRWVRQDLK